MRRLLLGWLLVICFATPAWPLWDGGGGGGGGGGGTPGGSDTQIQYNDGGAFGGTSALVYDDANDYFGIGAAPQTFVHIDESAGVTSVSIDSVAQASAGAVILIESLLSGNDDTTEQSVNLIVDTSVSGDLTDASAYMGIYNYFQVPSSNATVWTTNKVRGFLSYTSFQGTGDASNVKAGQFYLAANTAADIAEIIGLTVTAKFSGAGSHTHQHLIDVTLEDTATVLSEAYEVESTTSGAGGPSLGFYVTDISDLNESHAMWVVDTDYGLTVSGATGSVFAVGYPCAVADTVCDPSSSNVALLSDDVTATLLLRAADNDTAGNGSRLLLERARGTLDSLATAVESDVIGQVRFLNYNNGGFKNGGEIKVTLSGGTVSDTSNPTRMDFETTPVSSTSSQVVGTFDDAGSFGILTLAGASGSDLCYDTTTISGLNTLATCSSLAAHKREISPLDRGLDLVRTLQPKQYIRRATGVAEIGFLADDLVKLEPRLVTYHPNTQALNGVQYKQLTAVLTKAIQELDQRMKRLEQEAR